mmetsp:Transcript_6807/g.17423  ORF Transcript_6807/g.17423 Transcript_6807/m.17423 type:complete len:80 (-) Transcript_6807:58-297(-)
MRYELAQRLMHMKRIPDLHFTTVDIAGPVRVMSLIDQLGEQVPPADGPAGISAEGGDRAAADDELDFDWGDDGDDELGG